MGKVVNCEDCQGSGEIEMCSVCNSTDENCECGPDVVRETFSEDCPECDGTGDRELAGLDKPETHGFEYAVRIAVSMPDDWVSVLLGVGHAHYDRKCRAACEQGGVIFGCANTSDGFSTSPLSWRDLDTMTKIMEQAGIHQPDVAPPEVVTKIRAWLRETKDAISKRAKQLADLPDEISPTLTTSTAKV